MPDPLSLDDLPGTGCVHARKAAVVAWARTRFGLTYLPALKADVEAQVGRAVSPGMVRRLLESVLRAEAGEVD